MKNEIQKKLEALRAAYAQSLPIKIKALVKRWSALNEHFDPIQFREFHREVHSLCGTSGTYGYTKLSQASRDLEVYLKQLLDYTDLDTIQKTEITHLIDQIQNIEHDDQTIEEAELVKREITGKLIYYLVDKKEKFQHLLQNNLHRLGYHLVFIHTLPHFQSAINTHLPAVIIIDDAHLTEPVIEALANFSACQIPLFCLAQKDDLTIRLKSIRAGVSIFLHKPVDVLHFTNQLLQFCDVSAREDYRVLILDDEKPLAAYYTLVLNEAGMNTKAITSATVLMQELQEFKPNLLLLDLYLPECTGFDIAKMIRQEECYMSLPIIFISTETDRIKQLAILNSCGADDFLTKPVLPQNLISAVKSRAQRAALVNSYIALDSLTKLLNHTYILKQLEFEILRAERLKEPIAVAMIDLDHFKQINDQYGHPMGDLVLKKLSDLFVNRVRKTDFVGRYGGEEFSIIFPNTSEKTAFKLCNELRKIAANCAFEVNGKQFYVTLSIGVATYPTFHTVDSLVAAADRALYRAKSNGRNRVENESP